MITFRPAQRENLKLLIGLAGTSGSGKTYTALRLATGLARGGKIAGIDTEAGRMLHYADLFKFDHADLKPPFRPQAYLDAVMSAEQAGYAVIVIDSASHEHAGEGGLLDWHEEQLDEFVKRAQKYNDTRPEYQLREANNMRAWIEPKMQHKAFVQKLLQVRAHIIFCFRAEPKVEMKKNDKGKMEIVPKESPIGADGYIPIAEKNLPYEMTTSFLLTADAPGVPKPIKLEEQHRAFFDLTKPVTERTGELLAEWAAGGKKVTREREEPMSYSAVMTAIKVAEKPDHVTKLKPYIAELKGDERKKAIGAAEEKLKALKTAG